MTAKKSEESSVLSDRGFRSCRGCGSASLVSVLDLGMQPLANRLLRHVDDPDPVFPLHLKICSECLLGQVGEVVLPETIFSDYPYLSSISSSWVLQCRAFAIEQSQTRFKSVPGSGFILEVASNDGHLLQEFKNLGFRVLGVEPASNVADLARNKGITTISEFFGTKVASDIVDEYGYPDLVVANNVLAHVPDLNDFALGLSKICGPDTQISIENPSFLTLLTGTQFDTIYHEHYSYLSVHSVRRIAESVGLELSDVQYLQSHGGSYRYWLQRRATSPQKATVEMAERKELQAGMGGPSLWETFANRSRSVIGDCESWLSSMQNSIVAYGAAAKGNTLLNAVGRPSKRLSGVFDGSPEKIGKYLPGSNIPIWDSQSLTPGVWQHMLILPWNIRDEVADFVWSVDPQIQLWTAIPSLTEIPRQ